MTWNYDIFVIFTVSRDKQDKVDAGAKSDTNDVHELIMKPNPAEIEIRPNVDFPIQRIFLISRIRTNISYVIRPKVNFNSSQMKQLR